MGESRAQECVREKRVHNFFTGEKASAGESNQLKWLSRGGKEGNWVEVLGIGSLSARGGKKKYLADHWTRKTDLRGL